MSPRVRAILLMVFAMAGFALADALIKLASSSMPVSEVMLFVSIGGLVIYSALSLMRGDPIWSPRFWDRFVIMRNISDAFGTACMIGALALAPLVQVIAVTQILPVLAMIGAVFILGERVGWRRWVAVSIGLLGVVIILRPGSSLEWGAIFALGSAAGLALRDVFTRRVPKDVGLLQLVIWGLVFLLPTSVVLLLLDGGVVWPSPSDWGIVILAVLLATSAYLAITASVRMWEVSEIIPFRYTRIVFGTALGIWMFDETLDGPTIIGAILIVSAGLFILLRERRTVPLSRDAEVG